jgi:hypothetical protein
MTSKQIEERMKKIQIKHDAAKKIRETLDEAREAYGAERWDEDCLEEEVLEMVGEQIEEEETSDGEDDEPASTDPASCTADD